MNTIEQARDVAECLRALTRNRNDGSAYLIAADTIDALIADLNEWRDEALSAQERFKAAEDKLANIKGQKPVGVVVRVDSAMAPGCSYLQGTMIKNTPDGALLYLAAGAQPVPAGYQLVPVEPTDKMVQASLHLDLSYMPLQEGYDRVAVYKAMLAAAPVQAVAQHTVTCQIYGHVVGACSECNAHNEVGAQPVPSALLEAVDALLSNEEHAVSGGMRSYQVGSQTWELWEDVRKARMAAAPVQAQTAPNQEPVALSRLKPFVSGLGKAILDELMSDAAGAQPAPTMESIKNAAKAAGLEFDCFSYEGTNQLVDFVAILAAAPDIDLSPHRKATK